MKQIRLLAFVLVATQLISACTVGTNPISGRKRTYGYSWEQEVQIGREQDALVQQQFGIYEDPELNQYVQRVAQEVLAESHLRRPDTDERFRNTPFTFRILDSPVVNAFALPGGYIYLTRGLLTHLQNEAQLSVVLGHEIAHVAARHASQQAASQQLGQLGVLGGAILGGVLTGNAGVAENILNIGSQAASLLFLSYGRDAEREADQLGVEYSELSGYEAAEGAEFFESLRRINEREGAALPTFLSTHPDPGERRETIRELAASWDAQAPGDRIDQEQYLRILEGVVFGENPRQGFTENNTFYHPDLAFQFPVPSGFQVVNQTQAVILVGPNQEAIQQFTISQGTSAQQAATQFANQEGLTILDSGASRSGNLPAYAVYARAATQQGEIDVLSYFVEYDGRVYNFQGIAAAGNFDRYRNAFLQTAQGFRPVTDSRILNVQPVRLNVAAASRTAAFSTFVPNTLPNGVTPQDLAIVNQVELNETIQQGTLLKLPAR